MSSLLPTRPIASICLPAAFLGAKLSALPLAAAMTASGEDVSER